MAAAKALLVLPQGQGSVSATRFRRAAAPGGFVGTTQMFSRPLSLPSLTNERCKLSTLRLPSTRPKAAAAVEAEAVTKGEKKEDEKRNKGTVLLTMTAPKNADLRKLETLLFEWANDLPPVAKKRLTGPLKVDKVKGGVRLGFARIGEDGAEEVPVHIDCTILPPKKEGKRTFTIPVLRVVRNLPVTGKLPPAEKGVLHTLADAHQTWVRMLKEVPS